MNIVIDLMSVNDYDEVYRLWTNTAGMGMNNIDDSYDGIKRFLSRNPNTNFVARVDNNIIGVILCGHDGRRGHIYHTAVAVEYRNMGVGKILVDNALQALSEENISKVTLVSFKTNDIGNAFWDKVGFTEREDLIYRNKIIKEL